MVMDILMFLWYKISMYTQILMTTYLQRVQDGKQPCKDSCVFIDCQYPNDPCHTKQRQEDECTFHGRPKITQKKQSFFWMLQYT